MVCSLPEIVWLSELNCNRPLTPHGFFSADFFAASPRAAGAGGLSAAGRGSVFKPIPEVNAINFRSDATRRPVSNTWLFPHWFILVGAFGRGIHRHFDIDAQCAA